MKGFVRTSCVLVFALVALLPRLAAADTITLMWDPSSSSGVAGYVVYVGTSSGAYTNSYNVGNSTQFALTNAVAGQTYYFAVAAYSSTSELGALSGEISGASAPAPTSTTPTPSTGDTLTLMWDPSPSPDVTGYMVRVGTSTGNYTNTYDVGNALSFVLQGAVPGQRYFFAVSAYTPGPVVGPASPEVSGFSNAPPALTNPGNQTSTVGTADTLQLVGSDPSGSPVTYSATGLPPGLAIASSTGYISGTPTTAGTYTVTARVSDGTLFDTESFTWTVSASNGAPVLTNPGSQTSQVGSSVSLQLSASDPNGNALTFTATGLPPGLSISSSGRIAGTPTTTGTYSVSARVSDGSLSDTEGFSWSITFSNAAPVLTNPGNQSGTVGTAASLQLSASDPNGNALTYSAVGLPPGLSISSGGRISGTPTTSGSFTVTATVSDGSLTDSEVFNWSITSGGDAEPPTVDITSPTSSSSFTVSSLWVTLGGRARDDTEVVEVRWSNDRGGSGKATGTDAWLASLWLKNGWNSVTVTAVDKSGKTSSKKVTVRKR